MVHEDELKRELLQRFGEDAALTSDLYLRTLRVLEQIALDANTRNASWGQRVSSDALKRVYFCEADVFAEVARELVRCTARIKDVLDGMTVPPEVTVMPASMVTPESSLSIEVTERKFRAPHDGRTGARAKAIFPFLKGGAR